MFMLYKMYYRMHFTAKTLKAHLDDIVIIRNAISKTYAGCISEAGRLKLECDSLKEIAMFLKC